MLDFITKNEYFRWIDNDYVIKKDGSLKDIQDAFIFSILQDYKGKRAAEMGGGGCRVLPRFAHLMECWNIDKMEGRGGGPVQSKPPSNPQNNIKQVKAYLGDFSNDIPDNYFDLVFSISVLEHIKMEDTKNVFLDIFRILKNGGKSYHAIDIILGTDVESNAYVIDYRLKNFPKLVEESGFQLIDPGIMDVEKAAFNSAYATNSDQICHLWCRKEAFLRKELERKQVVSLKLGFIKPG